jgi:penicillin V acylase-like amidase (Ntn superfamily)
MCTRIFWADNPIAKVVSRTMDWPVTDEPKLWALPAGIDRTGGLPGSVSWTSRFGSVVLSMFDAGTTDGINERGLGAHALYLDGARFAPPDAPGVLGNVLWAQWALDNFANVADAVAALDGMHIANVPVHGQDLLCHLALDDATGDSAIIEPLDGELVVHHGPQYRVMANAPDYDQQLVNLSKYTSIGASEHLPGDIQSSDRFVRASYFLDHLPEPANLNEALAGVIHLAGNVAVPPGAPDGESGVYPTWWTSAADLSDPTFYFWSRLSPNLVWVSLRQLDLSIGAPVLMVDPRAPALQGDIRGHFDRWDASLLY